MGLLNPIPRREDMATAPHEQLYMARYGAKDQELQDLLAAYEHRAFAREATRDNPLMAVPIAASIPIYQLAKLFGATNARSSPSLFQAGQGLLGIGEGLFGGRK